MESKFSDDLLKVLAVTMPSGQMPVQLVNTTDGSSQKVNALTPTYLACLILVILFKRFSPSLILRSVFEQMIDYIRKGSYYDPVGRYRVWHFNAFYPPDWEDTCWCTYLLYETDRFYSLNEIEALKNLLLANETQEKGVGVWIKDPYSPDNKQNNVFDPVVSATVSFWLKHFCQYVSEPTDRFLKQCLAENTPSLYYDETFKQFLYYLFGIGNEPKTLERHPDGRLFHHAGRKNLWYCSPEIWSLAELYLKYR